MSGQHTQGRLTASQYLDDGRYGLLSAANEILVGIKAGLSEQDARRLAACWNTCVGMTTEEIEALDCVGTIGDLRGSASAGWTSVPERLPDDDTLVLLALSDEEVWPGVRDGDIWRYADATPIESALVVAWMDLPAAPKRRAA
jgi:hypothetical protein